MEQRTIRDLVLYFECGGIRQSTWVLDPPEGRHGFRIVVQCRRVKPVPSSRPTSLFSHFSVVVQPVLSLFAFWHAGLVGSGSVLSITDASFRLATCSALTDFVSWVDAR